MSGEYVRLRIDPSISEALRRAEPVQLIKAIQGWVRTDAKPTLKAIQDATPTRSGELRESLGITMRNMPTRGEVAAYIAPRVEFVSHGADGSATLHVKSGKSLLAHGGRKIIRAARRGIGAISDRGPAQYAYQIETGHDHTGKVHRKAGGAHMFEKGITANGEAFIRAIGADAIAYLTGHKAINSSSLDVSSIGSYVPQTA